MKTKKLILFIRDYKDGAGSGFGFDTVEDAIDFCMRQTTPRYTVFHRCKIYIEDSETRQVVVSSKETKRLIREKETIRSRKEFQEWLYKL